MAVYWIESAVIGLYNVFKMLIIDPLPGFFLSAFFCVHSGTFMVVHGAFVTAFFFSEVEGGIDERPFVLLESVRWVVLVLLVSHGISFVLHWILGDERETKTLGGQMAAPYGRIVVMHVTILLGAFLVLALQEPIWVMVLFVVLKTVVDLRAHLAEHLKKSPAAAPPHTSAP